MPINPSTRRRLNEALTAVARLANSQRLAAVHAARSGVELPWNVLSVLLRLVEDGPTTMTALSRRCQLTAPLLTRHVRVLEEAGFARRSANPADGRSITVEATPAGKEAAARFDRANAEMVDEQLSDWSEEDLLALADALSRLVADLRRARGAAAMACEPGRSTSRARRRGPGRSAAS